MLNNLDDYYLKQPEEIRNALLFLRSYLQQFSPAITEVCKFHIPFFTYNNKMFCYLSVEKKTKAVYVGFIKGKVMNHKKLVSGGRKMVKVFYISTTSDIDMKSFNEILKKAVKLMV